MLKSLKWHIFKSPEKRNFKSLTLLIRLIFIIGLCFIKLYKGRRKSRSLNKLKKFKILSNLNKELRNMLMKLKLIINLKSIKRKSYKYKRESKVVLHSSKKAWKQNSKAYST